MARREWDRLAETDLDLATWRQVDPDSLQVVIVEDDDGQIVACWATMACRHVEGFWIRPDHRKLAGVLRRLALGMRGLLRELGATMVLTQAETPEVAILLEGAGAVKMRGTSYFMPANFGPWRRKES